MATTTTPQLLSTFQKHIEDMRNLVLCKICIKPLYEPYIISCGHTFCYSCLTSWFGGSGPTRKRDKRCPDCRATVKVQPAPNYLLRDLSHMFISRTELLPEDETTEEHEIAKQDETTKMARDRDGVGLFEGAFKLGVHPAARLMLPIRDIEDGVERCPECTWELEDGRCGQCGYRDDLDSDLGFSVDDEMDDESDGSSDASIPSDLDHDDDPIDGDFDERPLGDMRIFNQRMENIRPRHYVSPSTDGESIQRRGSFADSSQSGYSRESTPVPYPAPYRNYSDLDEDDEDEDDDTEMEGFVVNDNDDDDLSISRSSSVSTIPRVRRPTRVVTSDPDSEGDDSDEETDHTARRSGGSSAESSGSEESSDESGHETPVHQNRVGGRRRPVVLDDDDDEDGTSFAGTMETVPSPPSGLMEAPGWRPVQTRATRMDHLNRQRAARRGGSGSSGPRGGSSHYHPYQSSVRSPSVEILESRSTRGNYARRSRPYHPRATLST